MTIRIQWQYGDESGEYIDDWRWKCFDDAFFQWIENNYSCDCNRSILFGLAEKYPDKCQDNSTPSSFPCGDEIKITSIEELVNGKVAQTVSSEDFDSF